MFYGTIEDNIKYCKPEATDEEMKEVARHANAAHFIENDEFNDKGSPLKGPVTSGHGYSFISCFE